MTPEHVRLLYEYNSWANRRALDACATLSSEQFIRDLGSSYRSVRDTLAHIMGGEWFWLERCRGRSPTAVPSPQPFPDLPSLHARWEQIERELHEFVATRTAEDLARVHHYITTEGNPNSQPLWQMLQHVANHGSYHRGQLATMLRQLGAAPAATDLILYYRQAGGRPPAEASPDPAAVRLLYDYNTWANRRALDSCAALTGEQFIRDLGSSFRSVRDTLAHILGGEWVWLERWHDRTPTALPTAQEFPTLEVVRARSAELDAQLVDFVTGLSAEDLVRVHEVHTMKSGVYANALWQMLQHLVNHGSYHRGQLATMLRQLGAKPQFTDLIYFYREQAGQPLD